MQSKILSFATVLSLCLCLESKSDGCQFRPHTQLLYEAGGGTNVWFHSYMRCKMKPDEDYTFNRHHVIKHTRRVYYENGGTLEIFSDKIIYLGVTNFFCDARNYFLTPATNIPNAFIRSFK